MMLGLIIALRIMMSSFFILLYIFLIPIAFITFSLPLAFFTKHLVLCLVGGIIPQSVVMYLNLFRTLNQLL